MALKTIRQRGDTKINWETSNPILKLREAGYEWETTVGVGEVNVKIGDGVTAWNILGYAQKNMKSSDLAEAKVSGFTTNSSSYPVPAPGETVKVFMGKIKKFFEDIRNTTTGACFKGELVNNCVTNNAKLPLSAVQGKVLMDLYTQLNSNLTGGNLQLRSKLYSGAAASGIVATSRNNPVSFENVDGQLFAFIDSNQIGYISTCLTNPVIFSVVNGRVRMYVDNNFIGYVTTTTT